MHHDPDLQRHVHETGNNKKTITLLKRWRWFGLFVMLPSLLATIYYSFIAADVYVSESRFVIKAPDQKAGGGGSIGAILSGSGFGSGREQASEIIGYLRSRDALSLRGKIYFAEGQVFGRIAAPIVHSLSRW